MAVNDAPFPVPIQPGTLLTLRPRRRPDGAWDIRFLFRPEGWTTEEVAEVMRREFAEGPEDGPGAWR
jgi:hypothetical protein